MFSFVPSYVKLLILGQTEDHMKLLEFNHFIEECGTKPLSERSVVTIGNFDGCHKGHKKLLETTKAQASKKGLKSVVVTLILIHTTIFSSYKK